MLKQSGKKKIELQNLYDVICSIRSVEECAHFFEDLCTRSELLAMAERWEVAQRVAQGETYRKICEATGASTATITRVAQWVRYGAGGYQLALGRLKKNGRST